MILGLYAFIPVKNGAHPSAVSAAPMNVEACRQQDAVFYCDGAMRKGSDEELVPAWVQKKTITH